MIRFDKLTIKAQEALQAAQELAQKQNHAAVDTEHLLTALIQQPDGLVRPLLEKLGLSPDSILQKLDEELNERPQAHGAVELSLSRSLRAALDAAQAHADKLKDQYVSTEHMLLGLADQKKIAAKTNDILKALREVRGNAQVTDQNPEDKYQALTKYGRDLTEEARKGKLDPRLQKAWRGASSAVTCRKA
jgi:ATP-dependent Clp protease ATP-binding subunit ClpB